jgi:GT2 family glycosyltransferase
VKVTDSTAPVGANSDGPISTHAADRKLVGLVKRARRSIRDAAEGNGFVSRLLDRVLWLIPAVPRPSALQPPPLPRRSDARCPLVSVIIPCYNYGRFLPESIGSVLSQRGVDVEVIIVDDASTDDSAAVAERFAAADARVSVLRHTKNAGHVVTFNDGYAQAAGEFIVRLDADDLLTEGSLSRAIALFDEFPRVGLVYGHPQHFTTSTPPAARLPEPGWIVWSGRDWVAERCRRGVNCITTPEAIVRADVMKRIGALDTRLHFAQDMEMWLRVAAVSDVGFVAGPDQALHRDHPASMSATSGSAALLDLVERRTVFDVLFEGPGGEIPGADKLHDVARRCLAGQALERSIRSLTRGESSGVDELVSFAETTYPKVAEMPAWRDLQLAQGRGPRRRLFVARFLALFALRRLADELYHVRWTRTGT